MTLSPFLRILPVAAAIVGTSCAPESQVPTPEPVKKEAFKSRKPLLPPSQQGETSSISLDRVFELQQSGTALIYDARPSVLFNQGHIAGAINTPKSVIEDVIKVREPELKAAKASGKRIIVYCSGPLCTDSRTVARHLASHGYSSAIFSGGWEAWKAAGLPSE
jgi:rhodanese-related sulfurtransferase